ncbi:MAG: nucleotidyl transferase AbiEii/AbiGii toxin family protein, partial [Elusimicrobia bacterium]|nr:nucleotidyl transferase AbiEii/AbiGii toxin family protein [Elusimicrobiota bacterium]
TAIHRGRLVAWAARIGIPNLALAEHDLRLTHALAGRYKSSALKDSLGFKGGTALNKIYFGKFNRLSVDLDFNLIGPPQEAVKQGAPARKAAEAVLRDQDPSYEFKYSYRADQTTLIARYTPLSGGAKQPLKIELSTRESVPILGLIEKAIPSPDAEPAIQVKTYRLDELIATKIRALYDRKKGRDVFDLDRALQMEIDWAAVRKMAYYYFYRSGKVFNWSLLKANLEAKAADRRFSDDIAPFLRPDVEFDPARATRGVIAALERLGQADERDAEFLALAKRLLGRTKSPKKLAKTSHLTHPIKAMMNSLAITSEAAALTVDDIRLESRRPRQ